MAWEIAGYATALALLTAAGALTALAFRVYRSLRRWDRMAIRLALKADTALEEYIRLAGEARETAQSWRHTLDGFARLADGAKAVGDVVEAAAQAAANVASLWRDRTAFPPEGDDGDAAETGLDWAALGRFLGYSLRRRLFGQTGDSSVPRPGTSADPFQGE